MALKIRLRQQGKTNRLMYRLVVTEKGASRDGRYLEMLGWYNPHATEEAARLHIEADRVAFWLSKGAELSDKSTALLVHVAPQIVKDQTAREVTRRSNALAKRKARKARQAAA